MSCFPTLMLWNQTCSSFRVRDRRFSRNRTCAGLRIWWLKSASRERRGSSCLSRRSLKTELTIFTSDRFADHLNPPGHPERLERAEVMQVVASEFRQRDGDVREPGAATE